MTENRVHPHFLIELPDRDLRESDGFTHEDAVQHIQAMELGIRNDPYAFQAVLRSLGRAADAGTLTLDTPMGTPAGTDPNTSHTIAEYFRRRLDAHVDFDTPTEEAVAEDRRHAERVGKSRGAVNYRVSLTGSDMSHGMRTPQDAELLRDRARVSRLASYVQQVIAWQEQNVGGVA